MTVGILVALAIALGLLCIIMIMVRREAALPSPERARAVGPRTAQEGTATHEAGHAILAWLSPFVKEVTGIILEESGEGVTTMRRSEITSSARLWDVIAISLAGIAAEGYASAGSGAQRAAGTSFGPASGLRGWCGRTPIP